MEAGFLRSENFLINPLLGEFTAVLRKFHQSWLNKYVEDYRNGAINSAYITKGEFLTDEERLELLKFVSSKKIVSEARKFLGNDVLFLNTQLFFNPYKESQNNYWHRDIQYTGQSEEQQRLTIEGRQVQVLHLRLALADENGIELVPGSHFRWDKADELDVRLQRNGKSCFNEIAESKAVPLKRGDLLAFDANIIHRGLYGQDRFAFDILFCRPLPEITKYIDQGILPKHEELKLFECPEVFLRKDA